ncbi:alpha/beta hydrolase [Nocardia sp. NBC_00565]|uniref:alpha/beta fold hydrolase n=1 Tax=Nocardia sp. NBC_00565 TaxID=2975993 RepID=UPI002E807B3E|nr:alpha/beta hydrolase [Nocardia sp. NBC_00565]WUC06284.1 alpha/beta hydrolase [Nocardia sp. NBC_00565]
MTTATVHGRTVGYEVIGAGRPWVITPGGRFDRHSPGVRELATALAERGNQVLIWDRPNTGESDVCFTGPSESAMQADILAGLLKQLDMSPAVIVGGSGGARVSLLAAERHPDVCAALAVLWISGGVYGLISIGNFYYSGSIEAAWTGGMEAVAALPEWSEIIARNPANRQRFLDQDPKQFIATMEQWLAAFCLGPGEVVPGLSTVDAGAIGLPTLVFRSGASDIHHRRETSEEVARLLPKAQLVEPPWGDREWQERQAARNNGTAAGLFVRWPLLAPILHEWANDVLP